MGKLHKLRREIKREPTLWYEETEWPRGTLRRPTSAHFRRGKWRPDTVYGGSYLKFVRSVLRDLGVKLV